jgi:hypothetical protein
MEEIILLDAAAVTWAGWSIVGNREVRPAKRCDGNGPVTNKIPPDGEASVSRRQPTEFCAAIRNIIARGFRAVDFHSPGQVNATRPGRI